MRERTVLDRSESLCAIRPTRPLATRHPFKPGGKIVPAMVQMARQLLELLPTEASITSFSLHDTFDYRLVVASADGWQERFGGPDELDTRIKGLAVISQLV
jgi:hypothetical protein